MSAPTNDAAACEVCRRDYDWVGDFAPGAPCMGCGRYPAAWSATTGSAALSVDLAPDEVGDLWFKAADAVRIEAAGYAAGIAAERARVLAILDAPETREAVAQGIAGLSQRPSSVAPNAWAGYYLPEADAALATLRDQIGGQA